MCRVWVRAEFGSWKHVCYSENIEYLYWQSESHSWCGVIASWFKGSYQPLPNREHQECSHWYVCLPLTFIASPAEAQKHNKCHNQLLKYPCWTLLNCNIIDTIIGHQVHVWICIEEYLSILVVNSSNTMCHPNPSHQRCQRMCSRPSIGSKPAASIPWRKWYQAVLEHRHPSAVNQSP